MTIIKGPKGEYINANKIIWFGTADDTMKEIHNAQVAIDLYDRTCYWDIHPERLAWVLANLATGDAYIDLTKPLKGDPHE